MINISQKAVETINNLVHDAFDTNATLDRVKTILATNLICPNLSNKIHFLAHKYALEIGDGVGDLIELYDAPIEYGGIEKHIENYDTVQEAIQKVQDCVLVYQNELNEALKILSDEDYHLYAELIDIVKLHNRLVVEVIELKDIVDKYGDNPTLDSNIKDYKFLE